MEFRSYHSTDIWQILNKDDCLKMGFDLLSEINSETNWTGVENGYLVVGCGGFRKCWNGVYEAWLTTTYQDFMKYRLQTIKFMRKVFNNLPAHRIQATIACDTNSVRNQRFAEFIGFKQEGILLNYGPNKESYYLYAMVK